MREIKFRAWHKADKKMYVVLGFVNHQWFLKGKTYPMPTGAIVIRQYTGLKDKNGKGIYEGDALGKENHWPFYVGFKDSCFVMIPCEKVQRLNWTWHPIGQNMIEGWEIIGNIYENPDLLGE